MWTRSSTKGDTCIAACSGMGADAARRAFVAAEAKGALDLVISVGWAGALSLDIRSGEARKLSAIIDAKTGERFRFFSGAQRPESSPQAELVTSARVADPREKARLRSSYPNAVMVDMEAATVARLAEMRGIPVACIKGVSDDVGARLPDLNPYISAGGQLRLIPFLAHLAVRPRYWKAIAELNRNSSTAARAMCDLIIEFVEENNGDQLNRT